VRKSFLRMRMSWLMLTFFSRYITSEDASFSIRPGSCSSHRIPRMRTFPWLSPLIQRRIWPGLCFVGAACRTTALACVLGGVVASCWSAIAGGWGATVGGIAVEGLLVLFSCPWFSGWWGRFGCCLMPDGAAGTCGGSHCGCLCITAHR